MHVCTRKSHIAPGVVLTGPFRDAQYGNGLVGQAGALVLGQNGAPIWFHPAPKNYQDSTVETGNYGSSQEPVIAFWQGIIAIPPKYRNLPAGAPVKGSLLVYNDHYKLIKTIKAQGKGWITDFHDLLFTKPSAGRPDGTAIFFAAKKVKANLSKYGGQPDGSYEDQEIQEVNLANNKLVFQWDINKHIPLRDSKVHAPKSGVWDAYHANSIDVNKAGDLLLSLRDTWGIYELNPHGKIVWSLVNGKGSNYKLSSNARYYWQHDVRFDGSTKVSMFDDGCCNLGVSGPEHAARGLILSLSKKKKSATVVKQFHHVDTSEVPTGGDLERLSNGNFFIGWGQSWFYSEYSKSGKLVYDAAMPKGDMSYRTLLAPWKATPSYSPSAAVRKTTLYASWNGATSVASWKVLGGKSKKSQTKAVGHAKRSGFETSIHLTGHDTYYKVEALGSNGKVLGSKVIKG